MTGRPPARTWTSDHRRLRGADLDTAETRLSALGAVRPEPQPLAERWRVLLDPAGHPFCLTAK
ncbi:VOC family protein [Streptomyces albidoflavus]|uniref:VOC family protein n=1 Tax=Streptomyces albidoflavus TaxID=1886 RepID=UPI0028BEBB0E|nr:VOC family protein [Streptomyces albidoflavus]